MNELPACALPTKQSQDRNRKQQSPNQGDTSSKDPEQDSSGGGGGGRGDSDPAKGDKSLKSDQSSPPLAVSPGNLQFISEYVKRECNLLLDIDKSEATGQEEALVIAKELETLSIAAQHMDLYPSIQQDADLLRCSVSLLRNITEKGKSGDSVFKREEKASAQDNVDPHHPVYGLKKDLIRLIANMAYKHRANQDLVRTLDGIPLLLDLTMIDTRNPFITQWVVLAIRNLVEGNRENRDVLSGMSLQGMAGHMAQLREMGVHTELRGGKIVVKPVDK
ncbi:ataxin-10-like [Elysia marginata]|uniref:Ataxin-10 n=1 Tax=Elysia marginata TaxID=1093978 RepID=A0AAV4I328_9GAST|nr:ataxin-10-like [Elysia marginata]